MALGFDSASNRNEYQEYFLWSKGSQCLGLTTLAPSSADCLEIWEHQSLEPSGPVEGCNGIALPSSIKIRIVLNLEAVFIIFTEKSLLFYFKRHDL